MDNVEKCDSYVNIPSSQICRSYILDMYFNTLSFAFKAPTYKKKRLTRRHIMKVSLCSDEN
jgi:hypothetical protein